MTCSLDPQPHSQPAHFHGAPPNVPLNPPTIVHPLCLLWTTPTLLWQTLTAPLANSNIFPTAANASPGSPEPWNHSPTIPDP
ncbi:hypothetical protein C0989_001818, partial [Termitomyces sp. Mn162]